MVGSELNPTQGKRGGKPGDIGASSFRGFREYFRAVFALVSRSLLRNCTKTLASAVKSPLFFFPRQCFARALQSESLEQQATPEPSSVGSWLCSILPKPLPGAWAPASACLLVFVTFYV